MGGVDQLGKNALPLKPRPGQKLRKTDFHTVMDVADFATLPVNVGCIFVEIMINSA